MPHLTIFSHCDLLITLLVLESLSHQRLVVRAQLGVSKLLWPMTIIRVIGALRCSPLLAESVRCDLLLYIRKLSAVQLLTLLALLWDSASCVNELVLIRLVND